MNIMEEQLSKAAKDFSDEIDFAVLLTVYKESGWTEVEFEPRMDQIKAKEIENWLKEHCKGHRISRGRRFLFENEKDAMWFLMKWS